MNESDSDQTPNAAPTAPKPLPSEKLILDFIGQDVPWLDGKRCLVLSPGRAQLADRLLDLDFEVVQAWYLDLHEASCTQASCRDEVEVLCGPDLPEHSYDLIALPTLKRSEVELTRDLLQQAHDRLETGGYLLASVNNPKDTWLHDQLRGMFEKVTNIRQSDGCVYWAKKSNPLKKMKDFSCQFNFKEREHILQVYTRPGVFSHRRLDPGAKQLLNAVDIGESDNVLDMGCGGGAISLAAAKFTSGKVYGVDANSRAVQCLARGAELNDLTNVVPVWNADGQLDIDTEIDLALANPPYFGDHVISQHFVDTCVSVLRPGGALLVVTKQPNWYEAYFDNLLEDVEFFESARYFVVCGRKPLS